ncbi:MAG: TetR/AcrR family transcriptional regulator [Paenibacillaceae bacterium]|jgi:AcrR family transcriptional regulator|nr:TetR/AcrR family transcriptional regulator [Paenibacillaceae bacterium]
MTDKRMQVMEAAIKLFAEKGFHAASIQEIADSAGIAKGSMYLYFKSKDDLLLHIYKTFLDRMFAEIAEAGEGSSTPRERLKAHLRIQLENIISYHDFILMQMREQFINNNKDIKQLALQIRSQSFSLMQERIIDLYGEDSRPWSLDGTQLFDSMVNSYTGILILHNELFNMEEMVDFLLDRLDDIMAGLLRSRPKPLLKPADLEEVMRRMCREDHADQLKQLFNKLRATIVLLHPSSNKADDLLESLQVLEEELQKANPKRVIVQGMLTYLLQSGNEKLKKQLRQLQTAATAVLEARSE